MKKTLAPWGMGALLASSLASPNAAAQAVATQARFAPITFKNASVHDPSVIKSGNTWYVFDSHLATAKSTNPMNRRQVSNGISATNPLFLNGSANVFTELAKTFSWAQSNTLWAADVRQLADGRFYMYDNACKGDSPRSALGLAVADRIEGPYVDKGIFLRSGMWGQARAMASA